MSQIILNFERFEKSHGCKPKSDINGYVKFLINMTWKGDGRWKDTHGPFTYTSYVEDFTDLKSKMQKYGENFAKYNCICFPFKVELLP